MMADTPTTSRNTQRFVRGWFAIVFVVGLMALAGCKHDKEAKGTGVARGKDPLIAGPGTLIPRQNMPIPDRATGPGGRPDPLVSPTSKPGEKVGYNDDPTRFKGTYIPGKATTPAALAGRIKDSDELKIDDTGGVPLEPAGGTQTGSGLNAPASVEPLYTQLEQLGVKKEDRSLVRENGKWVFRASRARTAEGAKTEYTGVSDNAQDAVKQVVNQISADK